MPKVFRDDYITFRRDRCSRGGGVFICVKNYDCRALWTNEVFEMIAVEVKGRNRKFTWEVVGVYRAPNEDMRAIRRQSIRNRTREIASQRARAARWRWWLCVAGTLSFILTMAASCHFN